MDSIDKILAEQFGEEMLEEAIRERRMPEAEIPLILSVDDKPGLLTAISSALKSRYKVISVTSGPAALKAIEVHTPAIFLLDIEMPGMNGFELAANIRKNEKYKKTPIIFLTSMASREHVINAVVHGGNDYLVKPVDSNILLEKIQFYLTVSEA